MKKKLPFAGIILSTALALWVIIATYLESSNPTSEIIIVYVFEAGLLVFICMLIFLVSLGTILRQRADNK